MITANNVTHFEDLIKTAPPIIKEKLEDCKGLRERPDFHPEPNTFEHIKIVTERLMETGDCDLILAGCLHDICKVDTLRINPKTGHPTCPGHENAAVKMIEENDEVSEWIRVKGGNVDNVKNIVAGHMRFHQIPKMRKFKQEAAINMWKAQGVWEKLRFHGAADNMMEDFDVDNIDKSFKGI